MPQVLHYAVPDPAYSRPACSRGRAVLVILTATTLAFAVDRNDGAYDPMAIASLIVALLLGLSAALAPDRSLSLLSHRLAPRIAITLCIAIQFAIAASEAPAAYPLFRVNSFDAAGSTIGYQNLQFYWALTALAALLTGSLLSRRPLLGSLTVPVLAVLFMALCVWLLRHDTKPFIDVLAFQRDSTAALAHGRNPYSIRFLTVYPGQYDWWYGPGMTQNGLTTFGYPYMPLNLFINLSGFLLGDVRYTGAAAVALAALLMSRIRRGTYAAFPALAAAALMFMPRTLYVVNFAWSEPVVVLLLALTVYCAVRLPTLLPYALGFLIASKQFMCVALVLTPLLVGWNWRRLLAVAVPACLTAAVVTLPLALLDFPSFVRSVVKFQMMTPFRSDSLSLLVLAKRSLHLTADPPSAIGFAVLAAVAVLTLLRRKSGPAEFAIGLAVCLLAFFAFNKQAFLNYYFLVIGALWCAVAALGLPDPEPPEPASASET
jgi:hypothetical protein